jgi:hypothetical protein
MSEDEVHHVERELTLGVLILRCQVNANTNALCPYQPVG